MKSSSKILSQKGEIWMKYYGLDREKLQTAVLKHISYLPYEEYVMVPSKGTFVMKKKRLFMKFN